MAVAPVSARVGPGGRGVALVAAFLLAGCAGAQTGGGPPGPPPDVSLDSYWDWQLGGPVDFSRKLKMLDVDPDSVSAAQIAQARAAGVSTIAYISVGTWEDWRADKGAFPASVKGNNLASWPGEKYLDIRQQAILLPIMQARFQRARDKGFDAIEPDNMDVYANNSGFTISAADTVSYVKALASIAHGMGLEIGQKNVPELTGQLANTLDFVITEDCFDQGWCSQVLAYRDAGKPVLAAEYTDTGVNWSAACSWARAQGVHMILKDRNLTAQLTPCN